MIDTHCHIDDPQYAEGLDAFLAEQRQDGVECILVPGVDKTSVKDVLEVCDRNPDYLFPALGLHPENVKEDWREQLATIKAAVDARMHQLPTANCQLSTDIATVLYTGLMTDTGNFSYNSNRPQIYGMIAQLIAAGADKDAIYNAVFNQYSVDRVKLVGYCLYQKMRVFPEHHTALIYLSRKELYRFNFQKGDAEGIVNMPLQSKDIHYSVFMREDKATPDEMAKNGGIKTKIKLSFRSQGNRPVNVFAQEIFAGGGHANAAGGEFYGPLPEAVQRFLDNYTKYLKTD